MLGQNWFSVNVQNIQEYIDPINDEDLGFNNKQGAQMKWNT